MRFLFISIILFTIAGCAKSPALVSPNAFTEAFLTLDAMTAAKLSPLSEFTAYDSAIYIADYRLGDNTVVAVYANGSLIKWGAEDAETWDEHDLGVASRRGLAFGADGHRLAGATRVSDYSNIGGITLWDVDSGMLIRCITFPCEPQEPAGGFSLGFTIDAAAEGHFVYNEGVVGSSKKICSRSSLVNSPDANYQWDIGAVALDEANQRYAIIYQEGRIQLRDIKCLSPFGFSFSGSIISEGVQNDKAPIIDSQFDATGEWLAFIRHDILWLWNVDKRDLHLSIEDLENPADLVFDQTGQLLFVVSDDTMTIWDVEDGTLVEQYEAPGITSIAISKDNRLVIWGDMQGNVHLWAVMP